MSSDAQPTDGDAPDDRGPRQTSVRAAQRLHDPVRADRDHGAGDVDHPGRPVRPRPGRLADPRHLPGGRVDAVADHRRLARGADQRAVRHRGPRHRQRRRVQQRRAVRRHRRRAVHPRHRRVHRHHDEDRRHPGRDRAARRPPPRPRAMDDPDPDDRVRDRRDDVRDGRGEPRLLRAHHHRDDRCRLRRAHRRAGHPPRLRDRCARLDRQPVRHRHRVRLRRRAAQRRARPAARHPGRRPGRRDLVRAPLRRAGPAGPVHVARVRHEGGQRGALRRRDRRRHGSTSCSPASTSWCSGCSAAPSW